MIETITVEITVVKTKNPITWAFISMPDCKLYLLEIGYQPEKNLIQF